WFSEIAKEEVLLLEPINILSLAFLLELKDVISTEGSSSSSSLASKCELKSIIFFNEVSLSSSVPQYKLNAVSLEVKKNENIER
ncbi:39419_t:CDS:2, partial [Gigaspora margarita]